ncbi:MAG: class I SAM-dependent RNA methyltransferase [Burkholderiales bacterium]
MLYFCFASTNKGLEQLLVNELTTLGATELSTFHAWVKFRADLTTLMKINLHSRIASRVMLQVGFASYRDELDIYNLAYKIKWPDWFNVDNSIKVATTAVNSPLKSLDFITLRVKDAVCDSFVAQVDQRPNVNKYNPDIRIYNFLTTDTITIYLDTSGEGLFKRGYRQSKLEAPLKENLAAGLLQLANWQPDTPFYDPMCGSGTLAIEAISYGLNLAPGLNREFAFEKFNNFNQQHWHNLKLEATQAINYSRKLHIYANDIDHKAINIAQANFKRLGLLNYVTFDTGNFLTKLAPASNGLLITNPPYGIRLDEQAKLAELYPQLASHLKNNYANWTCYFFTADLRLPKLMRLKPSRKVPLYNGSLECRLFEFKMVSGSNR